MKINTKLFFIFFSLLLIDQIVKYFSENPICNKNIAWNIPLPPAIFYFAWFAIIAVLSYIFIRTDKYWQKLFLVLILSGAISNLIDRLRLGCVVDHIDLKIFPVFNLADVYISIGAALIFLAYFSKSKIPNTKY